MEKKKFHYINISALLGVILCSIVMVVLIYFIMTKRYRYFVTPRLEGVLVLCCIFLFVMIIASLRNLGQPCYKANYMEYLLLVVFGVVLVAQVNVVPSGQVSRVKKEKNQVVKTVDQSIKPTVLPSKEPVEETNVVVRDIHVKDEEFYQWISKLCKDDHTYKGAAITAKGMVYKDADLKKQSYFAIVRLAMVCCSADVVPVGPICDGVDLDKLKKDSYVSIEGIVDYTSYQGQVQPIIHVKKIKIAKKPAEEYVYP